MNNLLKTKQAVVTSFVVMAFFILTAGLEFKPVAAEKTSASGSYPKNFIPFWSEQDKGYETTLINAAQIVSITPVYDDPTKKNPKSIKLIIEFSGGSILEVDEDFEDFYSRVRASQ